MRITDTPTHWLAHYFAEIAQEWSGWEGNKEWLGDGFVVRASTDKLGHVAFNIALFEHEWRCEGVVTVGAGRLAEIVESVNLFFGVELDSSS